MDGTLPALEESAFADALATLGNPLRLRLLRALRVPTPIGEIEVKGNRAGADRVVARQTVRVHLDQMLQAGFVLAREGGGRGMEYVVNHQALFALSEEVRGLARLRPLVEPDAPTRTLLQPRPLAPRGPRFVLVRGLDEGATFPLPDAPSFRVTIGRQAHAQIALDYDPFVSAQNSVVERTDGILGLRDAPGSRNGTFVNQARLEAEEVHPLQHGDLVEVGRSALLYRER